MVVEQVGQIIGYVVRVLEQVNGVVELVFGEVKQVGVVK